MDLRSIFRKAKRLHAGGRYIEGWQALPSGLLRPKIVQGHLDLEKQVDVLTSHGQSADVAKLVDTFAPHWRNNRGFAMLGRAAFKAGLTMLAEP